MDDDTLGRLVAYEKYVKLCFAQAAGRRWLGTNAAALQEYEQIKEFKNYISALVDLAFDRYGMENGLTKAASTRQDAALNKDLESLVVQLRRPFKHLSQPGRQFALVS
jgi:hypothetical protein